MSTQTLFKLIDTPHFYQFTGANQNTTLVQTFVTATFAAVSVPANSKGVYIIPDNANTGTITFKGITGDTGVNIRKAAPSLMSLDEASASFGLLCAAGQVITFVFF